MKVKIKMNENRNEIIVKQEWHIIKDEHKNDNSDNNVMNIKIDMK